MSYAQLMQPNVSSSYVKVDYPPLNVKKSAGSEIIQKGGMYYYKSSNGKSYPIYVKGAVGSYPMKVSSVNSKTESLNFDFENKKPVYVRKMRNENYSTVYPVSFQNDTYYIMQDQGFQQAGI